MAEYSYLEVSDFKKIDAANLSERVANGEGEALFGTSHIYEAGNNIAQLDLPLSANLLQEGALQGDPFCLSRYGTFAFTGFGMAPNKEDGVFCFLEASEQIDAHAEEGNPNALVLKAMGHYLGITPNADPALAYPLFMTAAEAGDLSAWGHAGTSHIFGRGVAVDFKAAVALHKRAAKGDHATSQFALAQIYSGDFEGAPSNIQESLRWYEAAAAQGHIKATAALGDKYAKGIEGKAPDFIKAVDYYDRAAIKGHSKAALKVITLSKSDQFGVKNLGRTFDRFNDVITRYASELNPSDLRALMAARAKLIIGRARTTRDGVKFIHFPDGTEAIDVDIRAKTAAVTRPAALKKRLKIKPPRR